MLEDCNLVVRELTGAATYFGAAALMMMLLQLRLGFMDFISHAVIAFLRCLWSGHWLAAIFKCITPLSYLHFYFVDDLS